METFSFPIDSANAEQASSWGGGEGEFWAQLHTDYERLLGVFDSTLVEAAAVAADDRCLDIGCGTGATARALARRATRGSVVGLDLSGPMLAVARDSAQRAELDNIAFVQADAQVYPFDPGSFDVAVSRMGCMFFADPAAALVNIAGALRPGGRLACTVWQAAEVNPWITALDEAFGDDRPVAADGVGYAPGPFSMGDRELCVSLVEAAGFVDVAVEGLDVPLAFGTVSEAQAFLESWMDDDLDEDARERTFTSVHRLVLDHATPEGVRLRSATWLISARRP